MNILQTLEAALSAERETKRLIIADWDQAEHRARQRQNELEAECAALQRENAALRARVDDLVANLAAAHEDRNKTASDYFHAKQVEIPELLRENAALREALQSIADEAVKHHEHNPISGIDRLPRGYFEILKIATAIDATSKEAQP